MRTKLIFASVLLASCSHMESHVLSPYKMDIRQGNFISAEMREKIKLGMSKSQVRYVLGTPMVSDPFHADRWDYVYSLEQRGKVVEKQHYKLLFSGENLVSIDDGKTLEALPVIAAAPTPIEPAASAPIEVAPVVVAPIEAAPVTQPVAEKADPTAEILTSVQSWATAWSSKNTQDYLAAYVSNFKPQGMTHAAWEKQRVARITHPKLIDVKMSNRSVRVVDDTHAIVSFTQDYSSDAYHDQVDKTLSLLKQGGNWLIAEERAGKANKNAGQVLPVSATLPAGEEGAQTALKQWASAWAARDITQYLASYAPSFKAAGLSHDQWQAQRKARIGKAQTITVELSDVQVQLRDDTHATATFKQAYQSDSYHDNTRKTLQLEKSGDAWLIVSEQAAKK